MATKIQCTFRGRQSRLRTLARRREKGSVVATTNAWGETENGLALLVDLSGFKTKYNFSNVVTVSHTPASEVRRDALRDAGLDLGGAASESANKSTTWDLRGDVDQHDDDNNNNNDDGQQAEQLEELKGGSESLSKQLRLIEQMAAELEEDFSKTGGELVEFKRQLNDGLRQATNSQVSSRLNVLEYENELIKQRQREKKEKKEKENSMIRLRGVNESQDFAGETESKEIANQAENDMKECWNLIEQLQSQLY